MSYEHSGDVGADGDVVVLDPLLLDPPGVSFLRAVPKTPKPPENDF